MQNQGKSLTSKQGEAYSKTHQIEAKTKANALHLNREKLI